jgi:flagellar basal body-associated protein FliL
MAEDTKVKEVAEKPVATPKKRSLKKLIAIIIGVVVAVIAVIIIVVTVATSAPVKVANAFLADVQANNGDAAYALFSSEAKDAVAQSEFVDAVGQVGPVLAGKPDMQSKEISGETGSAATATVVYEVVGTDSKTYTVTINLIKENGEWKVEEFNSEAQ